MLPPNKSAFASWSADCMALYTGQSIIENVFAKWKALNSAQSAAQDVTHAPF